MTTVDETEQVLKTTARSEKWSKREECRGLKDSLTVYIIT